LDGDTEKQGPGEVTQMARKPLTGFNGSCFAEKDFRAQLALDFSMSMGKERLEEQPLERGITEKRAATKAKLGEG